MQIPAATLKSLLKKFSALRSEFLLLDTGEGTLSASDNDLRMFVESPALKDEKPAVVQINGRRLSSAISRLSGVLKMDIGAKGLQVSAAKTKFTLEATSVVAAKGFKQEKGEVYTLPLADLKALLKSGAVITQKGHASYSDIVELVGTGFLRVRATNELRLAVNWGPQYDGPEFSHLIPVAAIAALQEIPGESVLLTVSEALVTFTTTGDQETKVVVSARRSAKQMPDFKAIIPTVFADVVKVNAADMRESLARVASFIPADDKKSVLVTFPGSDIALRARSGGDASDSVPQVEPAVSDDDPFAETPAAGYKLYMNHGYLTDFFNAADGVVTIGLNAHPKPVWMDGGKIQTLFTLQVPA